LICCAELLLFDCGQDSTAKSNEALWSSMQFSILGDGRLIDKMKRM
jgi:hypothetical protein